MTIIAKKLMGGGGGKTLSYLLAGVLAFCSFDASAFSICAVGDSITRGSSDFTAHRIALENEFDALGWMVEWKGTQSDASWGTSNPCEGYSEKNAVHIATEYKKNAASVVADVLLLHAGHNYNADPNTTSPAYLPEADIVKAATNAHEQIITAARKENPNVIVLYAKVITSSKLPKYSYISALNEGIGALAADLTTETSPVVTVDMAEGWNPASDCVSDQVHPTATGAAKMAKKWIAELKQLVKEEKLAVTTYSITSNISLSEDVSAESLDVSHNATLDLFGHKLTTGGISGSGTIMSLPSLYGGCELLSYVMTPENNNTAKCYVDVGIKPAATDRIATKFTLDNISGVQWICGVYQSNNRLDVYLNLDGQIYRSIGNTSTEVKVAKGATYEVAINGFAKTSYLKKIGGGEYTNTHTPNSFVPDRNIYLFGANGGGKLYTSLDRMAKSCKMYYFRVQDKDGNLKVNMLPARRKSDGVVGFYDLVRERFIAPPEGAGALIAGEVESPDDLTTILGGSSKTPTTLYKGSTANLFNDNFTYKYYSTNHILVEPTKMPLCVYYDFGVGNAVAVNMYRVYGGWSERAPKAWKLYGSNASGAYGSSSDDDWVQLDSCDSQNDWTLSAATKENPLPAECRTKLFSNNEKYRYYRFEVDACASSNADYLQLIQLEYFRVEETERSGELVINADNADVNIEPEICNIKNLVCEGGGSITFKRDVSRIEETTIKLGTKVVATTKAASDAILGKLIVDCSTYFADANDVVVLEYAGGGLNKDNVTCINCGEGTIAKVSDDGKKILVDFVAVQPSWAIVKADTEWSALVAAYGAPEENAKLFIEMQGSNTYTLTIDRDVTVGQIAFSGGAESTLEIASGAKLTADGVSGIGKITNDGIFVKTGMNTISLPFDNLSTGVTRIEAGTVKIASVANSDKTDYGFWPDDESQQLVDVKSGATFDVNGVPNFIASVRLAKDAHFVNTGSNLEHSDNQAVQLILDGDATVTATGAFGIIAPDNAATRLDLGSHTLTLDGSNIFRLKTTTITGNGTIVVKSGAQLTIPGGFETSGAYCTLCIEKDGKLLIGKNSGKLTVRDFVNNGTIDSSQKGLLIVKGTLTPGNEIPNLTLADGAKIKATDKTQKVASFSASGTIYIDASDVTKKQFRETEDGRIPVLTATNPNISNVTKWDVTGNVNVLCRAKWIDNTLYLCESDAFRIVVR